MGDHNMVMMYGMPPDRGGPRFKPVKPMEPGKEGIGPVTQSMPGVQAMPPITHNPFTGEPVNLLELLASEALLRDEKKQLEALVGQLLSERKQDAETIRLLRGTIHTLETQVKALEFQEEQRKARNKKR